MARDEAGPGPESGGREYLYKRCPTCHIKVNVYAWSCPKCKNRTDWNANREEWVTETVHGSRNPEDRLYGLVLCSAERCMVCERALLGNPCRYAYCYGTGRGRCALCERYEAARYGCCQERQRENAARGGAIQNDPARGKGGNG